MGLTPDPVPFLYPVACQHPGGLASSSEPFLLASGPFLGKDSLWPGRGLPLPPPVDLQLGP